MIIHRRVALFNVTSYSIQTINPICVLYTRKRIASLSVSCYITSCYDMCNKLLCCVRLYCYVVTIILRHLLLEKIEQSSVSVGNRAGMIGRDVGKTVGKKIMKK